MQRRDIKVGESYAITNQRGKRASGASAVKGTVLRLDGEYEKRRGSYSSSTYTATDGIVVEFDGPVVFDHSGIRPLASVVGPDSNYQDWAQDTFREEARTQWVVSDPRFVIERWDTYDERQREYAEVADRYRRESDERAAAFKPVLRTTMKKLREAGFKDVSVHRDLSGISFYGGSISLSTGTGTDGEKKATGFGHNARLMPEQLLRLIGAEAPKEEAA